MPVFHVEPAQPRSSSSPCWGRASVVTSRSPGTRAAPCSAASSASRTDPPTRCTSKPAWVNRRPSSVSTGERSTSARTVSWTAGGTGSPTARLGGVADTTSQGSGAPILPFRLRGHCDAPGAVAGSAPVRLRAPIRSSLDITVASAVAPLVARWRSLRCSLPVGSVPHCDAPGAVAGSAPVRLRAPIRSSLDITVASAVAPLLARWRSLRCSLPVGSVPRCDAPGAVGGLALPCWHGWDGRAWTPRPPAAPGRRDLCRGPGGSRRRCDRAARCPHRPHRPPGPAALVPAQGAHRGGRDPRGHRRPRGRGGDRHHRRGRRAARHHRLLVRRRRTPGAQDRAPLPAARDRGRPLRRRHRGDRGRLGAPRRVERPSGLRRRTGTGRACARTAGRYRVKRTALVRAAVAPLLAVALGLAPAGAVASASPPVAATVPLATAAPGDDASDPDRPVRIDVGRFEPRAVTPGAAITVTGTLTNTGDAAITNLSVRLQRGPVLTSRAALAAAERDPGPSTTVEPAFQNLPGELPPGGRLEFSYTIGADALALGQDGVYPVLLNVNGTVGGDARRVGELPTFLVQQSVAPAARTAVGWIWPLTERTHRGPTGEFQDDDLVASISAGGRLDRALAVIERLPSSPTPGA